MSEPNSNPNPTQNPGTPEAPAPAPTPEKTFTQAELDSIVEKRLAKATKGMPNNEELTAFRAWKESQQTEQEKWNTLTQERDAARTDLTAAQAKIEQYEREKFLLGKGVPADDVDYYVFKIGKLVDDKTDFETAAAAFLAEHALKDPGHQPGIMRMFMSTGAPLGTGNPPPVSLNDRINQKLRGR